MLALVLLVAGAVLVAWVLVLLLLGCGRQPRPVRGGAGYLPGRPAYPAKDWHQWQDATPRARGRHA
jgi:hypothetical protein